MVLTVSFLVKSDSRAHAKHTRTTQLQTAKTHQPTGRRQRTPTDSHHYTKAGLQSQISIYKYKEYILTNKGKRTEWYDAQVSKCLYAHGQNKPTNYTRGIGKRAIANGENKHQ